MTKSNPVIGRWERFKRLTVWHPINTDPTDDYRHGPRFWYPGWDLTAMLLGYFGLTLGSPLLNRLFPSWFTDGMGVLLILSAICALVGVVFPKLFLLELFGKFVIVFMLGGYAGTVAVLSQNATENYFVVTMLFMVPILLGPRITWLMIRLSKLFALWRAAKEAKKGQ